jgi:hypothetical protein
MENEKKLFDLPFIEGKLYVVQPGWTVDLRLYPKDAVEVLNGMKPIEWHKAFEGAVLLYLGEYKWPDARAAALAAEYRNLVWLAGTGEVCLSSSDNFAGLDVRLKERS